MAGAGVSLGGAGMLRARRRDVSIKPNRKLDRKSSRGMIYENEELRLRTININAEVEQGQNDIKKLRRENEQLRHEIWSLRDEYDKLEEILNCQKNQEDSEDYEDRSEAEEKKDDDEAEECSDYSDEEAEEDCNEEEKDLSANYNAEPDRETNQEERLENAENQKISSEKMNTSNHRLHVEFDDLSVVDEEEELKKDKERKDDVSSEEREGTKITKETDFILMNPPNGYQCLSSRFGSPGASGSVNSYYPDRSFVFPNSDRTEFRGILPIEPSSKLLTEYSGLYDHSFPPVTSYGVPGITNVVPTYNENLRRDQMTYSSQVGWQSNIFSPNIGFQTPESYKTDEIAAPVSAICPSARFNAPEQSSHSIRSVSTTRTASLPRGTPIDDQTDSSGRISDRVQNKVILQNLMQRRNLLLRQPNNFYGETVIPNRVGTTEIGMSNSADVLTRNNRDFGSVRVFRDSIGHNVTKEEYLEHNENREITMEAENHQRLEDSVTSAVDRPKHFFAPLPTKMQYLHQNSDDKTSMRSANFVDSPSTGFFEYFGTEKSSSSDRTNSTVVSSKHFQPHTHLPPTLLEFISDNGEKGAADIFVNGGVTACNNVQTDHRANEERSYKSTDDLLIGDKENSRGNSSSRHGSNNPLVKSVSCQDLSREQLQNSLFEMARTFQADNKCQKFAKSDNTLDNPLIGSSKPFRSQLNVTLKFPCNNNDDSSMNKERERYSPEIPEIPKLPTIDYRLFNNPFLKTFDPRGKIYGNYDIRSPVTRPLAIQVNENSPDLDKMLQQHQQPPIDYSSAVLTQSFARRLNPEENTVKSTRTYGTSNEFESDRRQVSVSSTTCQVPAIDPRIIGSSGKQRQDFQVTSFEAPNPRSLHPGLTAYDIDSLRILSAQSTINPLISSHPKLYQNVPFIPGAPGVFCSGSQNPARMFYENQTLKVPAQTQTSIDGGSGQENEITEVSVKNLKISDSENHSNPDSPTTTRRKRTLRKERINQKTNKRPLSPAAQRRRLKKQSSIDNIDNTIDQKKTVNKTRQLSPSMTNTTTTTGSEPTEEKNESRSSSSGQESPRKERNRKVSMYFNGKKRPSIEAVKATRNFSVDNTRDSCGNRIVSGETVEMTNSERERTNSASSREPTNAKTRKSSISSGKVPWCACWGNGCV